MVPITSFNYTGTRGGMGGEMLLPVRLKANELTWYICLT